MRTKEKLQFIKRLSLLIRANIPIETSLAALLEQANSKSSKKIIEIVLSRVKSGERLSLALSAAHKSFNGSIWSIVRVGEDSGTLSESLTKLIVIIEKGIAIRSKIIQALLYPAVIACGTLALSGFLILYIFPKIIPIFSSLKVPLPFATKILIFSSTFLRTNFFLILLLIIFLVAGTFILLKFSKRTELLCSKIFMNIPVIRLFIQSYILARFSLLLSVLLSSHMKVDEAMKLVSESLRYPIYRNFLIHAATEISHGTRLSELCMKNRNLFPPLFINMVAIGEISGNFGEVLGDIASVYESELETYTKTFLQMIEPVLMIFMSLLVGFVAISIITPLYSITNNLKH